MTAVRIPLSLESHIEGNCAGFGLIDTLVALTLLAICLLGISGGVHFALRTTQATLRQTQAVDLVADLTEDLHAVAPDEASASVADWQARVRELLPPRDFEPPRLTLNHLERIGSDTLPWIEVEMPWKGLTGKREGSLLLPVTSPGAGALP